MADPFAAFADAYVKLLQGQEGGGVAGMPVQARAPPRPHPPHPQAPAAAAPRGAQWRAPTAPPPSTARGNGGGGGPAPPHRPMHIHPSAAAAAAAEALAYAAERYGYPPAQPKAAVAVAQAIHPQQPQPQPPYHYPTPPPPPPGAPYPAAPAAAGSVAVGGGGVPGHGHLAHTYTHTHSHDANVHGSADAFRAMQAAAAVAASPQGWVAGDVDVDDVDAVQQPGAASAVGYDSIGASVTRQNWQPPAPRPQPRYTHPTAAPGGEGVPSPEVASTSAGRRGRDRTPARGGGGGAFNATTSTSSTGVICGSAATNILRKTRKKIFINDRLCYVLAAKTRGYEGKGIPDLHLASDLNTVTFSLAYRLKRKVKGGGGTAAAAETSEDASGLDGWEQAPQDAGGVYDPTLSMTEQLLAEGGGAASQQRHHHMVPRTHRPESPPPQAAGSVAPEDFCIINGRLCRILDRNKRLLDGADGVKIVHDDWTVKLMKPQPIASSKGGASASMSTVGGAAVSVSPGVEGAHDNTRDPVPAAVGFVGHRETPRERKNVWMETKHFVPTSGNPRRRSPSPELMIPPYTARLHRTLEGRAAKKKQQAQNPWGGKKGKHRSAGGGAGHITVVPHAPTDPTPAPHPPAGARGRAAGGRKAAGRRGVSAAKQKQQHPAPRSFPGAPFGSSAPRAISPTAAVGPAGATPVGAGSTTTTTYHSALGSVGGATPAATPTPAPQQAHHAHHGLFNSVHPVGGGCNRTGGAAPPAAHDVDAEDFDSGGEHAPPGGLLFPAGSVHAGPHPPGASASPEPVPASGPGDGHGVDYTATQHYSHNDEPGHGYSYSYSGSYSRAPGSYGSPGVAGVQPRGAGVGDAPPPAPTRPSSPPDRSRVWGAQTPLVPQQPQPQALRFYAPPAHASAPSVGAGSISVNFGSVNDEGCGGASGPTTGLHHHPHARALSEHPSTAATHGVYPSADAAAAAIQARWRRYSTDHGGGGSPQPHPHPQDGFSNNTARHLSPDAEMVTPADLLHMSFGDDAVPVAATGHRPPPASPPPPAYRSPVAAYAMLLLHRAAKGYRGRRNLGRWWGRLMAVGMGAAASPTAAGPSPLPARAPNAPATQPTPPASPPCPAPPRLPPPSASRLVGDMRPLISGDEDAFAEGQLSPDIVERLDVDVDEGGGGVGYGAAGDGDDDDDDDIALSPAQIDVGAGGNLTAGYSQYISTFLEELVVEAERKSRHRIYAQWGAFFARCRGVQPDRALYDLVAAATPGLDPAPPTVPRHLQPHATHPELLPRGAFGPLAREHPLKCLTLLRRARLDDAPAGHATNVCPEDPSTAEFSRLVSGTRCPPPPRQLASGKTGKQQQQPAGRTPPASQAPLSRAAVVAAATPPPPPLNATTSSSTNSMASVNRVKTMSPPLQGYSISADEQSLTSLAIGGGSPRSVGGESVGRRLLMAEALAANAHGAAAAGGGEERAAPMPAATAGHAPLRGDGSPTPEISATPPAAAGARGGAGAVVSPAPTGALSVDSAGAGRYRMSQCPSQMSSPLPADPPAMPHASPHFDMTPVTWRQHPGGPEAHVSPVTGPTDHPIQQLTAILGHLDV